MNLILFIISVVLLPKMVEAGIYRRAELNLPKNVEIINNHYIIQLSASPAAIADMQLSGKSIEADQDRLRQDMKNAGIKFQETGAFSIIYNGISARLSKEDAGKVAALNGVKKVWPMIRHFRAPVLGEENGFRPSLQHAHNTTFVNKVQELGFTGKNIKVGVIDSGIDWGHPAFAVPGKTCKSFGGDGCRVKFGKDLVGDNFVDDSSIEVPDNDPMDCDKGGHGTHVAGILGGLDDKIRGVAPDVTFGAYRIFGCTATPSAPDSIIISAMEQAVKDGMNIINLSIGGDSAWASHPTSVAASNLVKAGVIVVAAAGNSGDTHGLYQINPPSSGKNVISVASFDNSFVNRKFFAVKGNEIPYSSADGVEDFLKRGIKNSVVVSGSKDSQAKDDACKALPKDFFKGKVALIRRGSCSIGDKVANSQNAGASGVIIFNNEAEFLEGLLVNATIKVPVIGISGDDGAKLVNLIKGGALDVSFPSQEKTFAIPTAGQPSAFSSWGLGNDLEIKPDIGGIGGQVFSSWVRSSGKSYNIASGSSMASPYIAGAVAAYLQAFPGSNAQTILEIMQNTARPSLSPSNPRFANSVAQQGAGLINALAFISSKTRVSPSRLALLDTPGNQMIKRQRIAIKNSGGKLMKYTVEHVPAQSIIGKVVTTPKTLDTAARVTMSPSSLTLNPGQTGAVDITIIGDTNWADSDRIIYSGYIKVIPESSDIGYSTIHVPYAGFKGNYDKLQPISNDEITFPDGAKVRGPSVIKIIGENGQPRFIPYDNKPFNLSASTASVGFQVNHPVRNVKLLWLDSKTEKVLGIAGTMSDAQQLGKKNDAPFRLIMAGVSGDPKECIPGKGSYKFKLTVDCGFDDGTPAVHSFISDVIEVSSNEPKGACEKP